MSRLASKAIGFHLRRDRPKRTPHEMREHPSFGKHMVNMTIQKIMSELMGYAETLKALIRYMRRIEDSEDIAVA